MQVAAYDRWEERTLWQFVDIGTFPLQPKYSSLEKREISSKIWICLS